MIPFLRTPKTPVLSPSSGARLRALVFAATVAMLGVLALGVASASAIVTEDGGVTVGVVPRNAEMLHSGLALFPINGVSKEEPAVGSFSNPLGHPVVHANNVYVIYWDPTGAYYHNDWQHIIDHFMKAAGEETSQLNSVFSVDSQYTDLTNTPADPRMTFRGAYTDTRAYPASAGCTDPKPIKTVKATAMHALTCLSDSQIQTELESFITGNNLPRGLETIYYVLTPPGVGVCLDGGGNETGHCSDFSRTKEEQEEEEFPSYEHSFCSYHGDINPGKSPTGDANTVLYGMIPWTAGGLADGQLAVADKTPAEDCQDGTFDAGHDEIPESKEVPPIPNQQQEPNQLECPGEDGFCDEGLADLIINQIAIEQQDIVTDPLLNGWQDSNKNEVVDECRNFFAPVLGGGLSGEGSEKEKVGSYYNQEFGPGKLDHYYLNNAFSLAALRLNFPGVPCLNHTNLAPKFTAPNTVNTGDIVTFNGMESDVTLNAAIGYSAAGQQQANYATYTWNYGDGTPLVTGFAPGAPPCENFWLSPCAASVTHSYVYGGTYAVTLTIRDVGGHTASVTEPITVDGPTKAQIEEEANKGGAPGTTGPGTTSQGGGAGPGITPKVVPSPIASASVLSRSLPNVLRKGLLVSYSVNEQVAGHFDVLLSKSLSRKLHVGGSPATGLPKGSAAQVVIAKAVLVTTKGGHSTVYIQLSKSVAAKLRHVKRLAVMLRLQVRNAATSTPGTTTVLATANLTGGSAHGTVQSG